MIHGLTLARYTGPRLYDLEYARFDDEEYFEFYRLHAAYQMHGP